MVFPAVVDLKSAPLDLVAPLVAAVLLVVDVKLHPLDGNV
jgi:hypothetical protein